MTKTIVQVNFNFWITELEYDRAALRTANPISETPGLEWKVWLKNGDDKIGGGIYLFESRAVAENYLESPVFNQIRKYPGFTGLRVKVFDVMEAQSKITRAPLSESGHGETAPGEPLASLTRSR